jgi:hypothetical protein
MSGATAGEKYLTTKDGRVCIPLRLFLRIKDGYIYYLKNEPGWLYGESIKEEYMWLWNSEVKELVEQLRLLNEEKK